jgi:hypothetical protein
MPLKRKAGYAFCATGLVVLLAGCGGKQNPERFNSGITPAIFNGFWDGFTFPAVLYKDIFNNGGYGLYHHGFAWLYLAGYVVGIAVDVIALLAIFGWFRSLLRRARIRAF